MSVAFRAHPRGTRADYCKQNAYIPQNPHVIAWIPSVTVLGGGALRDNCVGRIIGITETTGLIPYWVGALIRGWKEQLFLSGLRGCTKKPAIYKSRRGLSPETKYTVTLILTFQLPEPRGNTYLLHKMLIYSMCYSSLSNLRCIQTDHVRLLR